MTNQNQELNKEPKWWEKTVEYQFVIDNHERFNWISPLSGNEEKLNSDTIFGLGNKFILIEFKQDEKSQLDEFKKFNLYKRNKYNKIFPEYTLKEQSEIEKEIIQEIQNIPNNNCHFLVYADLSKNLSYQRKLNLSYQNYINYLQRNQERIFCYEDMIKEGIDESSFQDYLIKLQKLRNIIITNKGTSWKQVEVSNLEHILILDNKGNCFSFSDFQKALLDFNLRNVLDSIETNELYDNLCNLFDYLKDSLSDFKDNLDIFLHSEEKYDLKYVSNQQDEINNLLNNLLNNLEKYEDKIQDDNKVLKKCVECLEQSIEIGALLNSLYGELEQRLTPTSTLKNGM